MRFEKSIEIDASQQRVWDVLSDLEESIDSYTKTQDTHNPQQLDHIANEAMRVVKDQVGDRADTNAISNFVRKHKPDVLLYLPPTLELGKVLGNNNLDDRTGKMEGPISNLLHSVEKVFNSPD